MKQATGQTTTIATKEDVKNLQRELLSWKTQIVETTYGLTDFLNKMMQGVRRTGKTD